MLESSNLSNGDFFNTSPFVGLYAIRLENNPIDEMFTKMAIPIVRYDSHKPSIDELSKNI